MTRSPNSSTKFHSLDQLLHQFQKNTKKITHSYPLLNHFEASHLISLQKCATNLKNFPHKHQQLKIQSSQFYKDKKYQPNQCSFLNKQDQSNQFFKTHEKSKSIPNGSDAYRKKGGFWRQVSKQYNSIKLNYQQIEKNMEIQFVQQESLSTGTDDYYNSKASYKLAKHMGLQYLREMKKNYEDQESEEYIYEKEQQDEGGETKKKWVNQIKTEKKKYSDRLEVQECTNRTSESLRRINDAPKKIRKYKRVKFGAGEDNCFEKIPHSSDRISV